MNALKLKQFVNSKKVNLIIKKHLTLDFKIINLNLWNQDTEIKIKRQNKQLIYSQRKYIYNTIITKSRQKLNLSKQ